MRREFVLQLDFSIVNVALPTIQRDFHMAASQLQWIVTGYALTFGSLLLAGGRLADLLGRRRLLAIGLALFALASLACGLARASRAATRAWPAPCSPLASKPGAAVGLAVLATVAAARTAQASGSLVAGYRLLFLIATAMALGAAVLVAVRVSSRASQEDLGRQQPRQGGVPPSTPTEAQLRKC